MKNSFHLLWCTLSPKMHLPTFRNNFLEYVDFFKNYVSPFYLWFRLVVKTPVRVGFRVIMLRLFANMRKIISCGLSAEWCSLGWFCAVGFCCRLPLRFDCAISSFGGKVDLRKVIYRIGYCEICAPKTQSGNKRLVLMRKTDRNRHFRLFWS